MHVSLVEFYLSLAYLAIILGVTACLYGIFIIPVLIGLLTANLFCLMLIQVLVQEGRPTGITARFLSFTGVL